MPDKNQLSQEMIDSINNYGEEIKTLKDFVTACRLRPGQFIGPINGPGFLNMMREIFQNSFDQLIEKDSPCDWIRFFYDERTLEVVIEDNGKGFPFNDIYRILTAQYTSKNYEKKPYNYSSGLNGIGAKVVNALSEVFIVESYRYDGKAIRVEFHKGYPVSEKPKSIPNKEKRQGSKVSFIPDQEVMGEMNLEWKMIYKLIKQIVSLGPIGAKVEFEAIDINGKRFTETIINKDGIITDLIMKVKHPLIKPIIISADDGFRKVECAFCYDSGDEQGPFDDVLVTSFSNFCPTIKGTHVDGCIDGITRWFTNYMNTIYLANQKAKDKLKIIAVDIKVGLNIMISAAHLEPVFTGQAKEILSNSDMLGFCKETIMKGLDNWAKANPQDLARLSRFFKDIAEVRQKSEASKAKIVTKYQSNVITGLPAKYIRPLGKEDIELIIVEGESAKGTVETGRDKYKQGVFPIRGKIINAFKNSRQTFFNNEEVQGITRIILGSDYKRGFDVKDCKVSKVIFMADADVDGAHISALLLRMFVMYFPQMIEAGMVYKAIPPLYSIKQGQKTKYFTEQIDIVRYIQKLFLQKYKMFNLKKVPLQNKEVTIFFMRNTDYLYYLDRLANTYAVEPFLLEMVLNHYVLNKDKIVLNKLQKEIKSIYRFMDANKVKDSIIVEGVIAKSNIIIINDKFISDCEHLLSIIRSNDSLYYLINGEKKSIYQIMQLYNNAYPSSVQRYKGLGEMDREELAESTLYPGSDRTLVRYTLEDAKEEIEAIREYESNTEKILSLVDNVTRDDLLD